MKREEYLPRIIDKTIEKYLNGVARRGLLNIIATAGIL